MVFNAWAFVKEDKYFQLTRVDFLCAKEQEEVKLSEEHSSFEWKNAEKIIKNGKYPEWLRRTIEKAEKFRTLFSLKQSP